MTIVKYFLTSAWDHECRNVPHFMAERKPRLKKKMPFARKEQKLRPIKKNNELKLV